MIVATDTGVTVGCDILKKLCCVHCVLFCSAILHDIFSLHMCMYVYIICMCFGICILYANVYV